MMEHFPQAEMGAAPSATPMSAFGAGVILGLLPQNFQPVRICDRSRPCGSFEVAVVLVEHPAENTQHVLGWPGWHKARAFPSLLQAGCHGRCEHQGGCAEKVAAPKFTLKMPRSCIEGSKTSIKLHMVHEQPLPWRLEQVGKK